MKHTFGRILAASAGALALVSMGMTAASADDTTNPNFQGSFFIADAATAESVTGTIGFDQQVVALLDLADYEVKYPIPAGATDGWVFVSPRGQESTVSAWNAKSNLGLTPGGIMLPNVSLGVQGTAGGGSPNGINAVKAAGGDYSIGIAFTMNNGVTLIPDSQYFGHITVTAGTGDWTFEQATVAMTSTNTTLTAPATGAEGTPVHLSASVAPAGASGSVEFREGATVLATDSTAPYEADVTLAAGSHSITAAYLGDSAYAASTSAASTVTVAGAPVNTTLVVTAASASGKAGQPATYTAVVTPSGATGNVAFSALKAGETTPIALGSAPVISGTATIISNGGLGIGEWTITGEFTGTGVFQASSDSTDAALTLEANAGAAEDDPQDVVVDIDGGALTITTPHTVANPLDLGTLVLNQTNSTFELADPVAFGTTAAVGDDESNPIKITNSRPDVPTFTAQVASTPFVSGADTFASSYVGLINVAAVEVPGNALLFGDIAVNDVPSLSATAQTFATYPKAAAPAIAPMLGTAWIDGDINITGVPSSTPSGTYTATLTFSAF